MVELNEEKTNLYFVTLTGLQVGVTTKPYGKVYVLAEDAESAYQKVKTYLDANDIGFTSERGLASVELVATGDKHSVHGRYMLFM
jgi:hypothetical protein